MMESRPNAIRSAGADHQRYRLPITAALSGIDLHRIHEIVEDSAEPLIDAFSTVGHCDVVSQYAKPVTIDVLNSLLGCDPEISERAAIGAARMLDSGADAADGTRILLAALQELIWIKRGDPALTSPAHLSRIRSDCPMKRCCTSWCCCMRPAAARHKT
nr:cytochrome P450 [Nocardia tengchongensis]